MAETFQIHGLKALKDKLRTVDVETRNKTGFSALRKAAKDVVAADAKRRAARFDDPATPANIGEAIAIKRDGKRYKRTGELAIQIGVKPTAQNPAYHARFLERGTETMAAQPFLRPALEENIQAATDTFIREYEKKLARALKKKP